MSSPVVIIGAGPAGLAAGHLLAKEGRQVIILERNRGNVGGLSRTVVWGDRRFDIGGHRFFSKLKEVQDFWRSILGAEFRELERSSNILYAGKYFSYPLKIQQALSLLGPRYAGECLLGYLRMKCFPFPDSHTYEKWMINRFGRKLFKTFFETYTEKVWGMRCDEMSSDWAAQRTRGVNLRAIVRQAVGRSAGGAQTPRSFTDYFYYPHLGCGEMWEKVAEEAARLGATILEGADVRGIKRDGEDLLLQVSRDGNSETIRARDVISTATLACNTGMLDGVPAHILEHSKALKYRDFMIVALDIATRVLPGVQWLYVNESAVKMARVQNFSNWGDGLMPDRGRTLLGIEYFCSVGDELWNMTDHDLVSLAQKELCQLGMLRGDEPFEGTVARAIEAYPIYDLNYRERVAAIREYVGKEWPGLHLAGRGGLHRYNNMDHSVITGFMAARNILSNSSTFDPWAVNLDEEYIEADSAD